MDEEGTGAVMDQISGIGQEDALKLDPPRSGFSLLRLSVPARLAIVGIISALLWVMVWLWALQ
jgi:hypothetical protein